MMDSLFTSIEFYISAFAVLLSAISLLYTYHKNRDSLEVAFNYPVTQTLDAKIKKPDGELKPVTSNEVFFTQINVINSSNHDIGYSNLFIKIDGIEAHALVPKNEEDKIIVEHRNSQYKGNLVIHTGQFAQSGALKARSNNVLRVAVSSLPNTIDLKSEFTMRATVMINKSRFSNIFRSNKRKISNAVEVSHTFTSNELNFQIPPPELDHPIHKFL